MGEIFALIIRDAKPRQRRKRRRDLRNCRAQQRGGSDRVGAWVASDFCGDRGFTVDAKEVATRILFGAHGRQVAEVKDPPSRTTKRNRGNIAQCIWLISQHHRTHRATSRLHTQRLHDRRAPQRLAQLLRRDVHPSQQHWIVRDRDA